MGAYINPSDMSKEDWLEKNALRIISPKWEDCPDADLLVCLVLNPAGFTAAAIAFSEREFGEFMRSDGRQKQWFVASKEKLLEVSNLDRYLEEARVANRLREE